MGAANARNRAVILVLALAFVVRAGLVLATPHYALTADPADYDRIARALADLHHFPSSTLGHGPTAYRPPGYPVFLAIVYAVAGHSLLVARLLQAVLGTVAVALLGYIVALLWDARAAIAAMAIAAVLPSLALLSAVVMSEALFLPLVLAAFAAAVTARTARRPWRWAAAAGLLAGLAILTRANGVVVLPSLVLLAAAAPVPWRARVASGAAVLGVAALTVAPWTVRNAREFHRFVPVTTEGGFTLAGTYNDDARHNRFPGAWTEWYRVPVYRHLATTAPNEAVGGARVEHAARRYADEHPGYVVSVWLHNTGRTLQLESVPSYAYYDAGGIGLTKPVAIASLAGFYALVLLALLGALTPAARAAPLSLWLTPLLTFALFVIVAYFRFRVTIEPFMMMLAALPVAARATVLPR